MNLKVSNEILATQFPKISKARTLDCDYACKEEATSANAHVARKKGHFPAKKFSVQPNTGTAGRKPYRTKQNTGIYPDICCGSRTSCAFFCSMSIAQITLCAR